MTNGSLMKVESIAECSHSAILLTCIKQNLVLKTNFGLLFERLLKTMYALPLPIHLMVSGSECNIYLATIKKMIISPPHPHPKTKILDKLPYSNALNSLHECVIVHHFCHLQIFFNIFPQLIISGITSECQTDWVQTFCRA